MYFILGISTLETGGLVCQISTSYNVSYLIIYQDIRSVIELICCRGRARTSTERLGRQRLDFIPYSPPPRPEGLSAKFQHPTMLIYALAILCLIVNYVTK